MKKLLSLVLTFCILQSSNAQTLDDIFKKADKVLKDVSGGKSGNTSGSSNNGGILGAGLSNTDIVSGLKEALNIGTKNASSTLNITNGFFGNQLIKILMPPEVRKIETTLRSFGMNKACDRLILSMNRAAEDAAGKAVPIFVNAITNMSITDGISILRGGNNAATEFLKGTTTMALTEAFRPVIQNSLGKVQATKYWSDIFRAYNK